MMIGNMAETKVKQEMTEFLNRKGATTVSPSASGSGVQAAKEDDKGKVEKSESGVVVEISENLKEMYQEQLESAKEAAENAAEGMEEFAKLMEIARRISRGEHVPANDEKKLAEYSSDLYQAAKAAATLHINEKHKKHKSLFDEEEEQNTEDKLRGLKREVSSASSSGNSTQNSDYASEIPVSDGGEAISE